SQVQPELAYVGQVSQKRWKIRSVHLACMLGDTAGEMNLTDDGDVMVDEGLACTRQLAVSTTLGSQIHDHRTGSHRINHLTSQKHRRRLARNNRRRDHYVLLSHHTAKQFTLAHIKRVILRARITARIFGVPGFYWQF